MKRTATLVAGLLLVTGTVFAATTAKTTGEVLYKNTVFETDAAVLQHVGDGDTQALKFVATTEFNVANKLELTFDEGNDSGTKLVYTNTGKETVFTAETNENDGLFEKYYLTAVNTKGKVKAQVKTILSGKAVDNNADNDKTDDGEKKGTMVPDTGADNIYLQYAVTPSVTTTFYPYNTAFEVSSVFVKDDESFDGFEGIAIKRTTGANRYEDLTEVQDLPGVKVEMTAGLLKGLSVKVGTGNDTDSNGKNPEAKFAVDAAYSTKLAGVNVKAEMAVSQDAQRKSKSALVLGATAKVANVDVQAEMLNVLGNKATEDFTGLYAKATAKVAMIDVTAKLANKKFGEATAHNNLYVEGKYTAAEVAGVKPTITGSYEMRQNFKDEVYGNEVVDKNTVKVVVDAAIVQDGITVTPALEMAKVSTASKATSKATIAVKYSF